MKKLLEFFVIIFLLLVTRVVRLNRDTGLEHMKVRGEAGSKEIEPSSSSTYSLIDELQPIYALPQSQAIEKVKNNQKMTEVTVFYNIHPSEELTQVLRKATEFYQVPTHLRAVFSAIANSQLQTAQALLKYLKKYPNAPVIVEGTNSEASLQEFLSGQNPAWIELIKEEFSGEGSVWLRSIREWFSPEILSKKYDDLSYSQKRLLVSMHGGEILYFLDHLKALHSECGQEDQALFQANYHNSLVKSSTGQSLKREMKDKKMYMVREFLATKRCIKLGQEAGSQHVALVYGVKHDFESTVAICKEQLPVSIKTIDCTKNINIDISRENLVKTEFFRLHHKVNISCDALQEKAISFGLVDPKTPPPGFTDKSVQALEFPMGLNIWPLA